MPAAGSTRRSRGVPRSSRPGGSRRLALPDPVGLRLTAPAAAALTGRGRKGRRGACRPRVHGARRRPESADPDDHLAGLRNSHAGPHRETADHCSARPQRVQTSHQRSVTRGRARWRSRNSPTNSASRLLSSIAGGLVVALTRDGSRPCDGTDRGAHPRSSGRDAGQDAELPQMTRSIVDDYASSRRSSSSAIGAS